MSETETDSEAAALALVIVTAVARTDRRLAEALCSAPAFTRRYEDLCRTDRDCISAEYHARMMELQAMVVVSKAQSILACVCNTLRLRIDSSSSAPQREKCSLYLRLASCVTDRAIINGWVRRKEMVQDTLDALMQLAINGPVPAVGFAVVVALEKDPRSMMLGPPELEELNAALC
jgi:hypothetical protein